MTQYAATTQPPGMPDIVVAIVNYKTPGLTIDCLRSLAEERTRWPALDVIVADNASPDDSVPAISAAILANGWGSWAKLLPMPKNGGFGYGNNGVVTEVLSRPKPAKYIWFLNSDTLVLPNSIAPLIACMEQRPDVGFAGSRLENRASVPETAAFRIHSIAGEFEMAAQTGFVTRLLSPWMIPLPVELPEGPCGWVSGASMMARTEMLQKIGGFDERFFLYFEECDLSLRGARAGFQSYHVPASRIVHFGQGSSASSGTSNQRVRVASYWYQSRHWYYIKNHGVFYSLLADAATITGAALSLTRSFLGRRVSVHPKLYIYDIVMHSSLFRRA
jgi:N-acetylglucosaminyl-diphospho-decaprenol L-rhamnosyltransferase